MDGPGATPKCAGIEAHASPRLGVEDEVEGKKKDKNPDFRAAEDNGSSYNDCDNGNVSGATAVAAPQAA